MFVHIYFCAADSNVFNLNTTRTDQRVCISAYQVASTSRADSPMFALGAFSSPFCASSGGQSEYFCLNQCRSACSAYDAVVPARGQALVKTDLSIAIPEGTYARVGELARSFCCSLRFFFADFLGDSDANASHLSAHLFGT
jgi:hypothetical protein